MSINVFEKLLKNKSQNFNETKNSFQKILSLFVEIKSNLSFPNKNSEEYSLKFTSKGFTTTPLPINKNGSIGALELTINFVEHNLEIICCEEKIDLELKNFNLGSLSKEIQNIFNNYSIPFKMSDKILLDKGEMIYNDEDSSLIWEVLKENYFIICEFKSKILKETSNINFWPHHFDIAMLLFSGNIIQGQDKSNWSYSREQMNFGFLFGDEFISIPYFYVTLYPFDKKITENQLNNNGYWYKEKWNGAFVIISNIRIFTIWSFKSSFF